MKKELNYFSIGRSYGGCQDWMTDPWMRLGGCAALAAVDSCIYFTLHKKVKGLCPIDAKKLTKSGYRRFGMEMKPYIRPRHHGVNKLSLYEEGFAWYLKDIKNTSITMECYEGGDHTTDEAFARLKEQIDNGYLIPYLLLYHKDKSMKEYLWHWFLLTGYEEVDGKRLVKAVTYSEYEWLDFDVLWDTGFEEKGGMILYHIQDKETK